jgi:hypothetical protein
LNGWWQPQPLFSPGGVPRTLQALFSLLFGYPFIL